MKRILLENKLTNRGVLFYIYICVLDFGMVMNDGEHTIVIIMMFA